MKIFYTFIITFLSIIMFAQNSGINTTSPNATLDIKAATDGSTNPEGLLIPSLTDAQIQAMPVSSIHDGMMIYNTTDNCVQAYSLSQWRCLGYASNAGLTAYLNPTYAGSTGAWVQDFTADNNTISFQISNNSNMSFSGLDFNTALELTNASSGLSYTPTSDYSSVTLNAGSVTTFTYNISGMPTTAGTLTANFNAAGGLSTFGNINISPKSPVQALAINFVGDYISNKQLDTANHSLQLTVRNNSLNPVSNIDFSNAINLSGVSGLSILPNQNMGVNIPANSQVILDFQLGGVLPESGTLTATFTATQEVSGNVSAMQQVQLFDNATASNLVINGTYLYGQMMSPANTITLEISNNNSFDLLQVDLSQALAITGAVNNISIAPNQNESIDIPANGSISITYNLNGTSMVQGGGILAATFSQAPFATLSATKDVLGNNNFYATPNSTTLPSTGGTYTFNINSSEAWTAQIIGDASNWMSITSTTGTDGNGTISISTQPKTSQYAQLGFITITRASDNASITIAVNQVPTDNFRIIRRTGGVLGNSTKLSIHSSNLYTIETNQQNLELYGPLPSFVESISIVGNNVIITPKERTETGDNLYGSIRFSYGAGYISDPVKISQAQKAFKCPGNSPIRADNGYKIWNSTIDFDSSAMNTLVESRNGVNDFSDFRSSSYYRTTIRESVGERTIYGKTYSVQNSNTSSLFINVYPSFNSTDKFYVYTTNSTKRILSDYYNIYVFIGRINNDLKFYFIDTKGIVPIPDLSDSVVISPVICVDGYDEDTPDVSGNAGWRN